MNREQKSGWLLALLTAMLVISTAFNMLYASRRIAESERRDCLTLAADIAALESAGALTESGARVTNSRRNRYAQIGCDPALKPPAYRIVPNPTPAR